MIYIAAAFGRAAWVQDVIASALTARSIRVASTWHAPPYRIAEDLDAMPQSLRQDIAAANDRDLASATAILVVASPECRQTWCELEAAHRTGLLCVVVEPLTGTMPLCAYRAGVVRVHSIADGLRALRFEEAAQ